MTWFKIDDGFHGHPKIADLPLDVIGLWTVAGSYCAQYLTDGFITRSSALRFASGDHDLIDSLVGSGLWIIEGTGYRFKNWSKYQPTKESVMAERAATKERVNKWRERQNGNAVSTPPPTRPDPTRPVVTKVTTSERGTRLPQNFSINDQMRMWAVANTAMIDIDYETGKFIDYWASKTGQAATKLDWTATWRNWMKRAQEFRRSVPTPMERARAVMDIPINTQKAVGS